MPVKRMNNVALLLNDLTPSERIRIMEGFAYAFIKKDGAPVPTGKAGHVGWGFTMHRAPKDLDAFCGSTENPNGIPIIDKGRDIGYWEQRVDREDQMLFLFKRRNYHAFKKVKVHVAYPDNAIAKAREQARNGYGVVGNNCLDHVYRILEAYGITDLPWPLTHPSPNDWFAKFVGDYIDL